MSVFPACMLCVYSIGWLYIFNAIQPSLKSTTKLFNKVTREKGVKDEKEMGCGRPEIWDSWVNQVVPDSSCGDRRGASSFGEVIYSHPNAPASSHTLKHMHTQHQSPSIPTVCKWSVVLMPAKGFTVGPQTIRHTHSIYRWFNIKWHFIVVCVHRHFCVYRMLKREGWHNAL